MSVAERVLRLLDGAVTAAVTLVLVLLAGYAGFALWDNNRVYAQALDVMEQVAELKPAEDNEEPSFDDLLAVNPDVCAWVTLDGTRVDYPVVQGEDNLEYLNKDVYGDFSLSGTVFLDTRCARDFSGTYSLVYGHHMQGDAMFGSLDDYLDEAFFQANSTGTLMVPGAVYDLEVCAVLTVSAGESEVFDPTTWSAGNAAELVAYVRANATFVRESALEALEAGENPQVVAFSTCSSEYTEARTVVLARMVLRG